MKYNNKMSRVIDRKECGAVSLFIVIFTMLLITIITVGFVRLMLNDQRQATTTDLSQSAYDSAMAGVEDAKRALIDYQHQCSSASGVLPTDCELALKNIQDDSGQPTACNNALKRVVGDVTGEVVIKQTSGDISLQQAYTCVKINLTTPDYLGTLDKDSNKLVPLVGTGAFNKVKIEWFSVKDLPSGVVATDLFKSTSLNPPLFTPDNWDSWGGSTNLNTPSVIRAQLIQFSTSGFNLGSFDSGKNVNTTFLYPVSSDSSVSSSPALPDSVRMYPTRYPVPIKCASDLSNDGYACSATLNLSDPDGGNKDNRVAYLNIMSLYKKANFRIVMYSDSTIVPFDGVEPEIDSTGRANDLFRRVVSRVQFTDANFPYPQAAVDITGNFCKNFSVTDSMDDYVSSDTNGCSP